MAIRLGLGPYEHRQPEAPSAIQARIYFLRTVEEVEPSVVSSLQGHPFIIFLCFLYLHFESRIEADKPLAQQTIREARWNLRRYLTPDEVKELMPSWEALTNIEGGGPVAARLQEWAESWHLHEGWCLDYAVRAMRMWLAREYLIDPPSWWDAALGQFEEGGSLMNDAIWDSVTMEDVTNFYQEAYGGDESSYGFHFEYNGFSYRAGGWSPFFDEIGEWRGRVTNEFLSKLDAFRRKYNRIPRGIKQAFKRSADEHVDKLRAAALKLGLKPTPKKWDIKHFRWLVYYQVRKPNWSYERIAKEYNADIKTVSSGVKRTARLIGLKLRKPLPAGRRPWPA